MSTEDFCLEGETYYDILESAPSASDEQIKQNYQRLVRQLHPDKRAGSDGDINGMNTDGQDERFLALQRAWSVLKDPHRRRKYDAELACREHSDLLLYETLDISELQCDAGKHNYTYPCRCGGCYSVSRDDFIQPEVTIGCDECSFSILVRNSKES